MTQPNLSLELNKRRKEIDLIDQKLLTLLNQRLRQALTIGEIKKEMGQKFYNPKRERKVLERLKRKNKGPLKETDLKEIFKTIIRACRRSQI
jgi:chorismate mutase-like protein